MYPRLPEPPEPQPDQTVACYGATLLQFVLAHDTTATLSTEQLELIDHTYPLAVAAKDLTPGTLQRLTDARHAVLAAIARRRLETRQAAEPTPERKTELAGGHLTKLQPPPIVQPPASTYAPLTDLAF